VVSEPASTFKDIAILWSRATLRCILTGDGTACVLVLRDGHKQLTSSPVPNEATALALARMWLRHHEAGLRGPSPPMRSPS
jgi:hypothetical protein